MSRDIVFPDNNEEGFIKIAEQLETKELRLTYPPADFDKNKEKVKELQKTTNVQLKAGIIVKNSNEMQKIRQKTDFIIAEASNDSRPLFESRGIKIIFNLENSARKDSLHHRNSGLNQVLCKLAQKNKIIIGFSFSSIINSEARRRAVLLGRISQNIRFCRKYKINSVMLSFARNPYEMRSLHDLDSFLKILH